MEIFIDIITVLWQVLWGLLSAIGTAVWQNLPAILEIKKIMVCFTPVGAVALYLGVPTIVITALIWGIKKAIRLI